MTERINLDPNNTNNTNDTNTTTGFRAILASRTAAEREELLTLARETAANHIAEANEKIADLIMAGKRVAIGLCMGNLNINVLDYLGRLQEPAELILVHDAKIIWPKYSPEGQKLYWEEYERLLEAEYGVKVENGHATPLEL